MTEPAKEMPWCVFVSGSRDLEWSHQEIIAPELMTFLGPYATLIHGKGKGRSSTVPGCDRVVDVTAREMGFNVLPIPALWNIQGNGAGPIRNGLCAQLLLTFGRCGYRMAMLGFSTGGRGTEGALELMRRLYDRQTADVLIKKIEVKL